jgi:hypothetical protein
MAATNYLKAYIRLEDDDTENEAALDGIAPGDAIKNGTEYNWVFPFDDSSAQSAKYSIAEIQRATIELGLNIAISSYQDTGSGFTTIGF